MPQRTLTTQEGISGTEKWDCTKIKSFYPAKEMTGRVKVAYRMGENVCQLYIVRGVESRIY